MGKKGNKIRKKQRKKKKHGPSARQLALDEMSRMPPLQRQEVDPTVRD